MLKSLPKCPQPGCSAPQNHKLQTASCKLPPPSPVAEIGTAHNGDLERGLELVEAAAEAGAYAVKVQVVFADEILPPEAGMVPLPGGAAPLYEVMRSLERSESFYHALAERAEKRGVDFFGTPYGEKSLRLLEELGVRRWKVASPELNCDPLLARVAGTGLPIILSTGVSRTDDIDHALRVIKTAWSAGKQDGSDRPENITLLHCITSYPVPEEQANLQAIPALAVRYGLPAGLSDHSIDPVLLPALACALGAVMVEKHLTLNRYGGGLDDSIALLPEEFARMCKAMRHMEKVNLKQAVDELAQEYGRPRVEAVLGSGRLDLAAAEQPHYGRTNRSLHAVGALPAGTVISAENTALLRTEKVLNPGLPPRDAPRVYGLPLARNIVSGDGIDFEDILDNLLLERAEASLQSALDVMVLSNSGWRGIFTVDGEHGSGSGISWTHRLLGAAMGLVWGEWLVRHEGRGATVLTGTDTRPTGPLLAEMIMRGLEHSGCRVLYAGIAAAPEIMTRSRQEGIGGFAYVSASHNPLGHNGVKFGLNGGVLGGIEAEGLRDEFRGLIADKGAAARLEAIVENVYPRPADMDEKSRSLSAYRHFLEEIAGGPGGEPERRDTLNTLRTALKAHPVGILADLNGSARCSSVDQDYLESLGVRFEAINTVPGAIAHEILPEGAALEPCRSALEAAHARDRSMLLGYVPDNDGDRGNLVIRDESIDSARILEAQEVFALAVLAELACSNRREDCREAVVVNGPTSHRIREIAAHYNAAVFEAEVGEANVVNRAAELRSEGYRVRILGEGSNGGCITHPAAVRDPLNTLTALLKLMRLPTRFADWCRRIGRPELAREYPSPAVLTASLPRYTTTPSSAPSAKINISTPDHAELKSAWEKIFVRQWLSKKNELKQKFGFADWVEINNEGTASLLGLGPTARTGRQTGGLKVVFRDSSGTYRGFLWMRGSGTEAMFRVMAELRGDNPAGEQELLEWMRKMLGEAVGA